MTRTLEHVITRTRDIATSCCFLSQWEKDEVHPPIGLRRLKVTKRKQARQVLLETGREHLHLFTYSYHYSL